MPFSEQRSKVSDISLNILNSLGNSWPVFASVFVDSRQRPFLSVEAISDAVLWLSDMGFIIYEALIRNGLIVELRDAALTARGREFLAGFPPAAFEQEPLVRAA